MRQSYLLLLAFLCLAIKPLHAQVDITGTTYTQDFDGLLSTGTVNPWTDNSTITGWYTNRTTYRAGTGSDNAGGLYSYGASASAERALGSVGSGSAALVYYGVRLKNNTAQSISSIQVKYRGEQWRNGGNTATQSLSFAWLSGATVTNIGGTGYTVVPQLAFTSPVTGASAATLVGNDSPNFTNIDFTITGLSVASGQEIMLRWEDINDGGNDHGLSIDDLELTFTYAADTDPPTVTRLTPLNNSVGVAQSGLFTIAFTENVNAGTGNVYVKLAADNSTVQTIAAGTATITGNEASFNVTGLQPLTDYYVEVDNGAFEDLAGNDFAGIANTTTWKFQTQGPGGSYSWNFNTCANPNLDGGFTQYSYETGNAQDSIWQCSDFGRGSGKALQMNAGTTGLVNQDWLISPALDLTAYNVPLLRFYTRTRFEGPGLQLKISTNYTGAGDPAAATWTNLVGKFPNENSDVWTLSDSINLSAYKQTGVYLAWVYTSTLLEGPRWSLEDVQVFNAATAAAPYTKVFNYYKNLGIASAGSSSAWRKIIYDAADITTNLTIAAPASFEVSVDGVTGSSAIVLTPAQANGAGKEFYTRLAPATDNADFSGVISFEATGLSRTYPVFGSSQTGTNTLDIICWNIEWFGGSQGPVNNDLQQTNVQQALQNLGADVYALEEVVDTLRLKTVVDNLPGYAYKVSYYSSLAADATSPNYATGQKLALVYKTSVLSNVTARGLMQSSASASSNWASGRFPLLVNADATINGITRNINFVVLHGKSGDALSDYNSRKAGADELKDTLDAQFSNANIILLGDYNDDLDISISAPAGGGPVTSYTTIISDSTDADSYKSLSLPLSNAGLRSTKANSDVIDHIVVSNELQAVFVPGSVQLRKDMEDAIADYAMTTSDHYPVIARFDFSATLPVKLSGFTAVRKNDQIALNWKTTQEDNSQEFIVERSADGVHFTPMGKVKAAGNTSVTTHYTFTDAHPLQGNNFYRLNQVDLDGRSEWSAIVKVVMGKGFSFSFGPNPATNTLTINVYNNSEPLTIQLTDLNGRLLRQRYLPASASQTTGFRVSNLAKGVYLLKITGNGVLKTEKIIVK
jgi:endonuclease/exonuclease/phosphatase family metal-dependent hydrolase